MADFLTNILGQKGIIISVGIMVFLLAYRYAVQIFEWIERQTLGTRTYILERLEILQIEIDPEKITIYLMILSGLFTTITILIFGLWFSWIFGFIVGFIVGFFSFRIPKPIIDYFVKRRIQAYQSQMVDALQLLANGIRAGLSVPQALGLVVTELPSPVKDEFNLILQQNRIGVTLEECFENLTKRIPTEDNDMFVSSINILRETGGNLAEVFDTIVIVIRERIRLQQKIDTSTAQGMFQGIMMAAMPFVMAALFASSDPESMKRMVTHPIGILLTILAIMLDFIGFMVIKKIVKIKI